MRKGRIALRFFVSSCMISHFGIKPDKGGSPPIESRMAIRASEISGVLFHKRDREEVDVE